MSDSDELFSGDEEQPYALESSYSSSDGEQNFAGIDLAPYFRPGKNPLQHYQLTPLSI